MSRSGRLVALSGAAFMTYIPLVLLPLPRLPEKAILVPSGDHAGSTSGCLDVVRRVRPVPSFAARIGDDQAMLLLIALKRWRDIRRRVEEDAPLGVAEDFAWRAEEAGELYPIG